MDQFPIILRKALTKHGEPVIMQKKPSIKKFKTRLTFGNTELRDANFDYLITKYPEKFISDEN